MAEIKAKVLEDETLPTEEKKDSQFDKESGMYKVDLTKPPKEETDAVQEQETKDGVLRGSSENEEAGEKVEVELQGVREEEEIILEEITDETNNTNETGVDGSTEDADTTPEQEKILQEEFLPCVTP